MFCIPGMIVFKQSLENFDSTILAKGQKTMFKSMMDWKLISVSVMYKVAK